PGEKTPARQFLTALAGGPEGSDLRGLPVGHVVAAQAARGDGSRNALIARTLLNYLLKHTVETQQLISAADRAMLADVFTEVWSHLRGSRAAVYQTSDEQKYGLFSLVAILDTADADRFLAEMKTLARIADGTALDLEGKGAREGPVDFAQLVRDL